MRYGILEKTYILSNSDVFEISQNIMTCMCYNAEAAVALTDTYLMVCVGYESLPESLWL